VNKEVLYLPREKIREASLRFETPFFLYEERVLRQNCRRVKESFDKRFADFRPLFAVKANPNPDILRIVIEEGFGFDASSLSEAWLAKRLKASGMYTGNYTTEQEFRMAKQAGLILNLDDVSLLPAIERIGVPSMLSFRINPGQGKGGMKSLVLAGKDAKFGVPFQQAPEAYRLAQALGVKRFGMHMMTGSNVLEERYFGTIVQKLLEVVAAVRDEAGVEIEILNMGGGLGVPYRPEHKSLDLDKLVRLVHEVVVRKCQRHGLRSPAIMIEPGRFIGATAGWLVSRVVALKDGYKKYVGLDASSNDMPRPSIYDAYHHLSVLNGERKKERVSVVGRICENNDQFARDRLLPICRVGDLLAIHNCGAHAYAMGHNYNGHPRHAEVLLTLDGTFRKIRRAETLKDLFRTVSV